METPEKVADKILCDVQLVDNTISEAVQEGKELRP